MAVHKKIRAVAKTLLQLSLQDDEVSSERVSAVLQALQARPPRNYKAVLREYLRLVQKQIARSQAVIEYSGALPQDTINFIEASLSVHYGRPINSVLKENKALIAGWRIRIGSDVYDSSILNRLHQLDKSTAN
jgi:F-type H+-transporting ATPase subunit delta